MGFKTERPFSFGSRPAIVAHRGASRTHPENTLPAFEAALAAGAGFVELDVRLTADGRPVVLHDADVARTTDGGGLVHELSFDQVRALTAGRVDRTEVPVPTLGEVLELVTGRAGVVIEIKNLPGDPGYVGTGEPHVEAAVAELAATGFPGPAIVCSFNPSAIRRAAELAVGSGLGLATGLLTPQMVEADQALAAAAGEGHGFVLPHRSAVMSAGEGFVERVHAAGLLLGTWTVDEPGELEALLRMGVDAVATNDPAMGVAVLHRVLGDAAEGAAPAGTEDPAG